MDDLRSWWEVPSIAHFCSLFRTAFDLTDFDIEDLEEGFLENDGGEFILDLLCRLLNGCYARKDLTADNVDLYVKDIIKYKWELTDNPIKEKTEFKSLTLREKVELTLAICEYRLDTENVVEQLKGFEGDSMRVEPLGKDKDGATYWYFYGSRLYKEDAKPKKEITKAEKQAKEKQRRLELKKKRHEEKKQRRIEKKKRKEFKQEEKKKAAVKAKEAEKPVEDDSNVRRSGRIRKKPVAVQASSSSEVSSSSSSEESGEDDEVDEDSDNEAETEKPEDEEEVKPTPRSRRRGQSKTNSPAKKETPNTKKTPGNKDSTPATPVRGTRSRRGTPKQLIKLPPVSTPQSDASTRRSSRLRNKAEAPPPSSPHYNSDTEDDADSGNESAESVRSEVSKFSTRSSTSNTNAGARSTPTHAHSTRTSRRPTVKMSLTRDTSDKTEEDRDEEAMEVVQNNQSETKPCLGDGEKPEKEDDKKENATTKDSDQPEAGDNNETKGDNEEPIKDQETKSEESETKETDDTKAEEAKAKDDKEQTEIKTENGENEPNETTKEGCEMEVAEVKTEDCKPELTEVKQEDCESEPKVKDEETKMDIQKTEEDSINVKNEKTSETNVTEIVKPVTVKSETEPETVKSETNESETPVKDEAEVKKVLKYEDVKAQILKAVAESGYSKPKRGCTIKNDPIKKILVKASGACMETKASGADDSEDDDGKHTSARLAELKEMVASPSKPAIAPAPSVSSTRWHVVCSSLDDWINLAEWFSDSTVRCEKSLAKVIKEDFLPVLPEIIEARENDKLRKQREQDLRRSNRLTSKMKDKMEQEKILAEALADEEQARIKMEEERRLKEEQLRLEEENKQREERRKAREERANRLSMRETRARFVAEGKEIPPELLYTAGGSQKYKDEEDSDDSRCDLKDEEDYQGLMKVINAMKYHRDCWPFLEPVTDEEAPGYSDVIKRPMDLSKIEQKVESREYRSTQHFLSDFRLMFNNCKRFNGQDSEFSECARSMELMLKKYIKRFLKEEPTDKYYEDKDFQVAGTAARGLPKNGGDKKYRPRRAASSRCMETVHKALHSDEEYEDEPASKRLKGSNSNMLLNNTPSHHNLLLQELKRQREQKCGIQPKVVTRGPLPVRPGPHNQGGVMIIPKEEMSSSGVLRMAATREIKRKVNPVVVHTGGSAAAAKRDAGLNIIDHSVPGSKQPKTIRIVAGGSGHNSVKETAESVKVSADGFLIISGKNSGIKVSENTKIVIQPQGSVNKPGVPGQPQQQAVMKHVGPIGAGRATGIVSQVSQPSTGTAMAQVLANKGILPSSTATMATLPGLKLSSSTEAQSVTPGTQPAAASHQSPGTSNTIQDIVGQSVANQAISPELQTKLDIAQRIMVLSQHKKRYMEQQQRPTGSNVTTATPAKVLRIDGGQGDRRSIEERLRDTGVSIDNNMGSVSQNVLSNVNIASDILDTYYSVLNKPKTSAETSGPCEVQAASIPNQSLNTSSSQITASRVSQAAVGSSGQGQSAVLNNRPVPEAGKQSPDVDQRIIEMLKQIKSGQIPMQAPTAVSTSQSSASVSSSINVALHSLAASVAKQRAAESVAASQTVVNEEPATKPLSSITQMLTGGTSISDLLKNALIKSNVAKLAGQRTVKTEPIAVTNPIETLLRKGGLPGTQAPISVQQNRPQQAASHPNISIQMANQPIIQQQTSQPNIAQQTASQILQQQQQTVQNLLPQVSVQQQSISQASGIQQQELHTIQLSKSIRQINPQLTTATVQSPIVQTQTIPYVSNIHTSLGHISTISNSQQPGATPVSHVQTPGAQSKLSSQQIRNFLTNLQSTANQFGDKLTIKDVLQLAKSQQQRQNSQSPASSSVQQIASNSVTMPASQPNLISEENLGIGANAVVTDGLGSGVGAQNAANIATATSPSPEKSGRQSLFDMFSETGEKDGIPALVGIDENDPSCKAKRELADKLRLSGLRAPSSSSVNYGSPLKTASVMEALKSKLHTLKPDKQEKYATTSSTASGSSRGSSTVTSPLAQQFAPPNFPTTDNQQSGYNSNTMVNSIGNPVTVQQQHSVDIAQIGLQMADQSSIVTNNLLPSVVASMNEKKPVVVYSTLPKTITQNLSQAVTSESPVFQFANVVASDIGQVQLQQGVVIQSGTDQQWVADAQQPVETVCETQQQVITDNEMLVAYPISMNENNMTSGQSNIYQEVTEVASNVPQEYTTEPISSGQVIQTSDQAQMAQNIQLISDQLNTGVATIGGQLNTSLIAHQLNQAGINASHVGTISLSNLNEQMIVTNVVNASEQVNASQLNQIPIPNASVIGFSSVSNGSVVMPVNSLIDTASVTSIAGLQTSALGEQTIVSQPYVNTTTGTQQVVGMDVGNPEVFMANSDDVIMGGDIVCQQFDVATTGEQVSMSGDFSNVVVESVVPSTMLTEDMVTGVLSVVQGADGGESVVQDATSSMATNDGHDASFNTPEMDAS